MSAPRKNREEPEAAEDTVFFSSKTIPVGMVTVFRWFGLSLKFYRYLMYFMGRPSSKLIVSSRDLIPKLQGLVVFSGMCFFWLKILEPEMYFMSW